MLLIIKGETKVSVNAILGKSGPITITIEIKKNPLPSTWAAVDRNNKSDNGEATAQRLKQLPTSHLEQIARDKEFKRGEGTQHRAIKVLSERAQAGEKDAKQALLKLAKSGINVDKLELGNLNNMQMEALHALSRTQSDMKTGSALQ